MTTTRRAFLATVGTAALGASSTSTVSAQSDPLQERTAGQLDSSLKDVLREESRLEGQGDVEGELRSIDDPLQEETPEHVRRSYDEDLLKRYRPLLVTRDLGSNTPTALFAYVSRSPEYEHTILSYWAEYPFQEGVSPFGGDLSDSHFGDHEPVILSVDEQTNELVEVVYSGYHWMAAGTQAPPVVENETGIHPKLGVVNPWHHYYQTPEPGVEVPLKHLSDDRLQGWLDNGWDEHIHIPALTTPWVMTGRNGRSDWWKDDVGTFSFEATLRRFYLRLGWYGADGVDADELRYRD